MHNLYEGGRAGFDTLHWGYRPQWAVDKGIPMAINARIEKASTGNYFRHMWRQGRVIVPADGWYEWTGEKGHKQPWYIRLKTDRPMFMAAITNFMPYKEGPPGSGFVIVTAAAEAGMVDVHDRRPVVFAPEDARLWMDNTLGADQAEHLARNVSLPPEAFEWYKVSTDANNAKNNDVHLIEPF
jgi:putative SOS response-associated peptidase YedK